MLCYTSLQSLLFLYLSDVLRRAKLCDFQDLLVSNDTKGLILQTLVHRAFYMCENMYVYIQFGRIRDLVRMSGAVFFPGVLP